VISKGYIAVFDEDLDKDTVSGFIQIWLNHFKVEQVCPGAQAGNMTLLINSVDDLLWEDHLQLRISMEGVFSWAYLTLGKRVIETSSLPEEDNLLPLEVLADLPGIEEVVDQENQKRLDELESEGII